MRCRDVLARRIQDRLSEIYAVERMAVYQKSLFEDESAPTISFENGFKFFDGMFDGVRTHQGRTTFGNHFTGKNQIPAFDSEGEDGEEFQYAMFLDAKNRVNIGSKTSPSTPMRFGCLLLESGFTQILLHS